MACRLDHAVRALFNISPKQTDEFVINSASSAFSVVGSRYVRAKRVRAAPVCAIISTLGLFAFLRVKLRLRHFEMRKRYAGLVFY